MLTDRHLVYIEIRMRRVTAFLTLLFYLSTGVFNSIPTLANENFSGPASTVSPELGLHPTCCNKFGLVQCYRLYRYGLTHVIQAFDDEYNLFPMNIDNKFSRSDAQPLPPGTWRKTPDTH